MSREGVNCLFVQQNTRSYSTIFLNIEGCERKRSLPRKMFKLNITVEAHYCVNFTNVKCSDMFDTLENEVAGAFIDILFNRHLRLPLLARSLTSIKDDYFVIW